MTEEHKQDILKVIAAARQAAEEHPEVVKPALTCFAVQTPHGTVTCGILDLWLDRVQLMNYISDHELHAPVKDLYVSLKQIWLAHALTEAGQESSPAKQRGLNTDALDRWIEAIFTQPDHYSSGKDSYYASRKKDDTENR